MSNGQTPLTVLSLTDPGDDMQLRVRYQSTYAAIVGLGMLIENAEIEEIYCEHHEDVLLRKKSGNLIGCQVKTRLPKLGPFKANDPQISAAISRFVQLDISFPDSFDRFIIATNVAFFEDPKNSKSLPYLVSLAQGAGGVTRGGRAVGVYVKGLCDEHNCKREKVWSVLARVVLQPELPQFSNIESELAWTIANVLGRLDCRVDGLMQAAKALVQMVNDASSKNVNGTPRLQRSDPAGSGDL